VFVFDERRARFVTRRGAAATALARPSPQRSFRTDALDDPGACLTNTQAFAAKF
jgi:hypothetical protein